MKRPDPDAAAIPQTQLGVALSQQIRHPPLHLTGGLIGEGDRQDIPGRDPAVADQIGDPPGDDPGLPRPGPRQHQERPLGMQNRLRLSRVHIGDYRVRFHVSAALHRWSIQSNNLALIIGEPVPRDKRYFARDTCVNRPMCSVLSWFSNSPLLSLEGEGWNGRWFACAAWWDPS